MVYLFWEHFHVPPSPPFICVHASYVSHVDSHPQKGIWEEVNLFSELLRSFEG